MQLYSCKVNLKSNATNQVPKIGVTVPEIIVLRVVHSMPDPMGAPGGSAPVTDIQLMPGKKMVPTGENVMGKELMRPITDAEEREYLERQYGGALRSHKQTPNLASIFGHASIPLPQTADGVPVPEAKKPNWSKRAQAPEVPAEDDAMQALA